jgi:uncharacterized membrane protein
MNQKPLRTASALVGAGLGCAVESALLRQAIAIGGLNTGMVRATRSANLASLWRWDLVLIALSCTLLAVGAYAWARAWKRPGVPHSLQTALGGTFMGWGAFSFAEGLLLHHVLRVHHIHPGAGQRAWDALFLLVAIAMIIGGWAAVRIAGERMRVRESMAPQLLKARA